MVVVFGGIVGYGFGATVCAAESVADCVGVCRSGGRRFGCYRFGGCTPVGLPVRGWGVPCGFAVGVASDLYARGPVAVGHCRVDVL